MSPPLESHEKATGSIGVDTEISLLSSPKQHTIEQNDQAMDLFLNQVADYNAHHLSFDQQHHSNNINNNSSSSSSHSGNGIVHSSMLFITIIILTLSLGMDPSQILQQQDKKVKLEPSQDQFVKPVDPVNKKGKQKTKENGHSSLLHVNQFKNLLHELLIHLFF